ncbi:MAG: DUF151 domain-containing protein [Desulfovibrio sp.]|jgi:hypothetical protein|nr:DUF151 domain-containing protein [Desulfovibrio sp.]
MVDLSVIGIFVREGSDSPFLIFHPHGLRKLLCVRASPLESFILAMAMNGQGCPVSSDVREHGVSDALPFFNLLPHELMLRLVDAFGGRVSAAELIRMEKETLAAELVVQSAGGVARLACRLADALLLALRCGAVIRMPGHLLVHAEDMDSVIRTLPEEARIFVKKRISGPPVVKEEETTSVYFTAREARAPRSLSQDPRRGILSAAQKIFDQHGLREHPDSIPAKARQLSPAHVKVQNGPQLEIKIISVSGDEPFSERTAQRASGVRSQRGEAKIVFADTMSGALPEKGVIPAAGLRPGAIPDTDAAGARRMQGSHIRISLDQGPSGKGGPQRQGAEPGIHGNVLAGLGLSLSEKQAISREGSEEERWAMLLRMLLPETKVPM